MTKIYKTKAEFNFREDKTWNGVDADFAVAHPDWEQQEQNKGCWNCSDCSDCSRCSGLKQVGPGVKAPEVPIIPEIHKRIYEAVSRPDALNMQTWHSCETTHCRGGWTVTLAGEAGKKARRVLRHTFGRDADLRCERSELSHFASAVLRQQ